MAFGSLGHSMISLEIDQNLIFLTWKIEEASSICDLEGWSMISGNNSSLKHLFHCLNYILLYLYQYCLLSGLMNLDTYWLGISELQSLTGQTTN